MTPASHLEEGAGDITRSGVVALIGRPNAGKSTLLNQLLGSKLAIVSDKPQTTRNCIRGVLTRGGSQAVLLDTPGIHRPLHEMNLRMMHAAWAAVADVDVVCLLVDASQRYGRGDAYLLEQLRERVRAPVMLLVNKIDLLRKPRLLPFVDEYRQRFEFECVYLVSALSGDGVEQLASDLLERLPPGPALFPPDQLSDVSERFLAQELIREQILLHTRDELPYTTGVLLESFEDEGRLLRIGATIMVERDSQKGIVIGRRGAMLKSIGSQARAELEQLLGKQVMLELHVKLRERWREDPRLLIQLGLER